LFNLPFAICNLRWACVPLTRAVIGVLMGGRSGEREVSLRTGRAVHAALRRRGYRAVTIDTAKPLVPALKRAHVQIAFLALHGRGGEDGTIQGFLETLGIPYTGSSVRASAMAMHKATAKRLMTMAGVPVAPGALVSVAEARHARPPRGAGWPLVVKPASEGSTIGVSIIRRPSEWRKALRAAHRFDREAIVEAYIPGRETTVGVLNGRALPVVEIRVSDGFYDYNAKYVKGRTQYLCPAPVPARLERTLRALALRAYETLGCGGAARVDFRVTPRGKPFCLEVNTIPGMTETSLLPMAAARAGLSYDALTEEILKSALKRAALMKGHA
jgi:D-alanine-D-alanine ligase